MPTKYDIDGATISCYLIGEPGSGTESLIPEGGVLQNYDEIKASLGPGQLFEDPYFPAVESSIAYDPHEKDNDIEHVHDIEWLRPGEILKAKGVEGAPIFIDNGGDPEKVGHQDDVNQNNLGDCWFLCSMAELSRVPDIFWMVVCKENLSQFNPEEYRGIFKFRFAAFGRLIEVVVDDRIPYMRSDSCHWSVEADNPRVFWAALMEKAYAKLYSSYQALSGGWIGDALQDFTGGVIDRYDDIDKMDVDELWTILQNADKAGFYMGASVAKEFENSDKEDAHFQKTGLGNNHAYSLLTTKDVEIAGHKYKLLRLRNPWGNEYEFKGKFNEQRGRLWKKLDEETKKQFPAAEDGEFWITRKEFIDNFCMIEIVNLNPFGSEGKTLEELCEVVNFSRVLKDGDWTEDNLFGELGGVEDEEIEQIEEENDDGEPDNAIDESEKENADEDDDDEDEDDEDDGDNSEEVDDEAEKEYTEEEYNTFCKNPQIKFTVPQIALDEDGKSEVVISLFQRYRRNLKKSGKDEVGIGMAVAKIENEYPVKGSEIFNGSMFKDLGGGQFRSHTARIPLIPGDYVVIPYNNDNAYGGFTVIVFTKK